MQFIEIEVWLTVGCMSADTPCIQYIVGDTRCIGKMGNRGKLYFIVKNVGADMYLEGAITSTKEFSFQCRYHLCQGGQSENFLSVKSCFALQNEPLWLPYYK